MDEISFLESKVQMPLINLHVRSTVITLPTAKLLISPGSKLTVEQLRSAGNVTDIIAPNLFHKGGVKGAHQVHTQAKLWAPVAADKKNEIRWDYELNEKTWPFSEHIAICKLEGALKMSETLFFHKKSKSLIVGDLCFNLIDVSGIGPWIILNLFGTYKKLGTSRFYMKMIDDKSAFEKSLTRVFAEFDFENIIVSHGENVIGNGKERLRSALRERGIVVV